MEGKRSIVYDKAYAFAIKTVKLYKGLAEKHEFVMSKQFLRSGTSVGANLAEANGAISNADFSSKVSIAYKESLEAKYWLSLLKDTGFIDMDEFKELYTDIDEIAKILFAILKTTRINNNIS